MPSISDTIVGLRRVNGDFRPSGNMIDTNRLVPLDAFGCNPGNLHALLHVPADLPRGAPLVVVLHGCMQTAGAYDRGSGWSELADRFGFAVLYPEQRRANNPNLCFNWFAPADTRRGDGEAESIREMVLAAIDRHDLDPSRVFITGLSAGGAMTSVMLATHPELFAAGAIIAGLPYGTAASVPEALERMRGHGHDRATLSARVRAAASHPETWPAVSVWHGTADPLVNPVNATMIVDQWCGIHGVGPAAHVTERVGGHVRRTWHDVAGRAVVEQYLVDGLGHGTPVATSGDEACGVPGAHMLQASISSTYRIAATWSIVPAKAPMRAQPPAWEQGTAAVWPTTTKFSPFDPGRAINDALRAAGLMKA